MFLENMGSRIKKLRLEHDMTLEELGNRVGVGKSTVRKWENGIISNMRRDKIAKLAEVFNISPGELMGWEKVAPPPRISDDDKYEEAVRKEMLKMNIRGKIKLLNTAKEMNCNPLYNSNYKEELAAAHERTDIKIDTETIPDDIAIMNNPSEWE